MTRLVSPAALVPASFGGGAWTSQHTAQPLGVYGSVVMAIWCAFFLLSPFYLLPSGYPQLADFAIVVLVPLLFVRTGLHIPKKAFPVVNAMSLFMLYAVMVNLVWVVILSDLTLVLPPCFFVFNFGACIAFLSLYRCYGRRFLRWTAVAVCASILIQVPVSFRVTGSGDTRVTGFFNNPNQLGYYAILYATLFWVWAEAVRARRARADWGSLCIYGSMAFLCMQSLSRAAVAGAALLLVLASVRNKLLLLTGVLAVCVLAVAAVQWGRMEDLQARFEKKSRDVEDEAGNRGYDRIVNQPQYLVLGAGEGAPYRIQSQHYGEMHSSLGTVLFCYGIVGLALFLYIFFVMAKGCGLASLLYLLPTALYSMTHMGLRHSEFWILLMFLVCLKWPQSEPAVGNKIRKVCAGDEHIATTHFQGDKEIL